jgi:hypothetical protein
LAEFATILGDLKLAVNVWETLKKDGKGGSVGIPIHEGQIRMLSYLIFEGNAPTASFSILCGKPSCRTCSLCGHIARHRSFSFGTTSCSDIRRTVGGQCRFFSKPS